MEAGFCPRRDAGTVAGCDRARRDARALAGTVEGWRPSAIGRQGTTESVRNRGDRATVPIENIWREKIRGCSYKGGSTSPTGLFSYFA